MLAKKGAIVTRITAVEELAGMEILCSDKTGTLTLNQLTIDKEALLIYGSRSDEEVLVLAARASGVDNPDAIDHAIVSSLPDPTKVGTSKPMVRHHRLLRLTCLVLWYSVGQRGHHCPAPSSL